MSNYAGPVPKFHYCTIHSVPRSEHSVLGPGESLLLDFGRHVVGRLRFSVSLASGVADAPVRLSLHFAELLPELDAAPIRADALTLSPSWIEQETITLDRFPATVHLPRRYAFRFVRITVSGMSAAGRIRIDTAEAKAQTSADWRRVPPFRPDAGDEWKKLDAAGLRTLSECMQEVFEDGPKRDRRLWAGDFYLEAKTSYVTFSNTSLVKRCLLLFQSLAVPGQCLPGCVLTTDSVPSGSCPLFDYALLYVCTVADYFLATQDAETTAALWPLCRDQLFWALSCLDENGVVRDRNDWWCFIDWNDAFNKQASAQGVLLYALQNAQVLAAAFGAEEDKQALAAGQQKALQGAVAHLWDASQGFFVSGASRQISWASQVWLCLGGALPPKQARALLLRTMACPPPIKLITPFANHFLVEALMDAGLERQAADLLRDFWGGMLAQGSDCFWELYDAADPNASPYGSPCLNSYCHAWGCTPSYFLRSRFTPAFFAQAKSPACTNIKKGEVL